MKNEQLTKFKEFLRTLTSEIDLPYFASEDTTTFEELREDIENGGGFNIEIIYYSRAMEYLTQNDNSLNESLNIAAEMCYEPQNLNSEILASLLASRNARNEFEELESEITNFLEELLNEEEEEEGE